MKGVKLNRSTRPQEQLEGTYPFGKNGVQDYYLNAAMNEPGFAELDPTPYTTMGLVETDSKPVLFSTDDTNSAIGYFNPDTGAYEPIIDDNPANLVNWPADGSRLGFKKANFITGESQRNYKGELVISFTDKVTFPKYLNCTTPAISKLDDLRLFPIFKDPTITLTESFGGNLPPGTYYVAISYERNDGTVTTKSEVSDGVIIPPRSFDQKTDKSVLITITNADTDYDYIRVYVIAKTEDRLKVIELSDLVPASAGTVDILYTGNNLFSEIDLSEVLTESAKYEKVQTIGQLNDSLYVVDLEKEVEINDMQPYASKVKIKWKSELIDVIGAPAEHVRGIKKSFMHEEVYAVYIQYHLVKGGYTKAFVTMGEAPTVGDLANSTEATTGGSPTAVAKYKVEDTIHTFDGVSKTGVTGVWQNGVETYPDTADFDATSIGGNNYRNVKVLHHKMPSIRWCKANLYAAETEYGKTKLDLLGIYAEGVTIPAKYTGIIDGYRLLYAKRTPNSTLIQGQSLLLHGAVNTDEIAIATGAANIYTTGGNFRAVVFHQGIGDYDDDLELTQVRLNTMRLHSFDLLFNKPSINPTFISNQLRLRRNDIKTQGYLEDGNIGEGNDGPIAFLIEYNRGINPVVPTAGTLMRYITSSFYLENGLNISKFDNNGHEACFAGTLAGANWPLNNSSSGIRIRGQNFTEANVGAPTFEETYLVNLLSLKSDVYMNFYSQKLIPAGKYIAIGASTAFFGGDTFLCDYTYHTYGRHDSIDTEGSGVQGIKVVRRFICESASNIHLRYEIVGNQYSKWYPKTALSLQASATITFTNPIIPVNPFSYVVPFERSKEPNQFGYSRDLNALNEFLTLEIFNPFREIINKFPYRIHRGGKLSRQNKPRSWRTFLPLDFYECQKNMGRIINVDSINDRLIIHHENALFLTQDKAKLDAGILSITLGTGDIFQFEPQMPVDTKHGYAGTQHELACVKIPLGYVFCDAKQSKIFILQKDLKDISEGLELFLESNLNFPGINTFIGNGLTIGWDDKYGRILFTCKNEEKDFTVSYNVKRQAWAFFHDYFPDMYITTRDRLFSLKESTVYEHNTGPVGSYYDGTIKPFFIDVVFRASEDMLLETVNWKTELLTNDTDDQFGTLTHISIWNSHQHSGRITLAQNSPLLDKQIRRTQGQWSLHDFRNILIGKGITFLDDIFSDFELLGGVSNSSMPWYKKEIMNDNWFCVRFEFDNTQNKQLILHDVNIQAQISPR